MFQNNSEVREARLNSIVSEDKTISARMYNLIMCAVVLYGLVANIFICSYSEKIVEMNLNPLVLIIGYIVLSIAGCTISRKSNNALLSFLGYNLVCLPLGLVISYSIYVYGGINSEPVKMAFLYTIIITAIMVVAATAFPKLFEKIGGALFIGLISLCILGIFAIFLQGLRFVYSLIGAGLFSLYIGYDFYRSQRFPKSIDNAVDCALDIYMDMVNLFLFLLRIFGRKR